MVRGRPSPPAGKRCAKNPGMVAGIRRRSELCLPLQGQDSPPGKLARPVWRGSSAGVFAPSPLLPPGRLAPRLGSRPECAFPLQKKHLSDRLRCEPLSVGSELPAGRAGDSLRARFEMDSRWTSESLPGELPKLENDLDRFGPQ